MLLRARWKLSRHRPLNRSSIRRAVPSAASQIHVHYLVAFARPHRQTTSTTRDRRECGLWTNTPASLRSVVRLTSIDNPSHARRVVDKGKQRRARTGASSAIYPSCRSAAPPVRDRCRRSRRRKGRRSPRLRRLRPDPGRATRCRARAAFGASGTSRASKLRPSYEDLGLTAEFHNLGLTRPPRN